MAQFSSELDKMLRVCTVRLRVGHGGGQGTGFFVAPGLILTCAHVVEAAQPNMKPIQVDWNGQSHTAKIQTYLAKSYPDLALLCLDLQHHPCVYLYQEVSLRDPLYKSTTTRRAGGLRIPPRRGYCVIEAPTGGTRSREPP